MVLLFFPVIPARAQSFKTFPNDTSAFTEALRTYMGPNLNEQNMAVLNNFLDRFRNGTLTEEEKNRVIDVCNRLKARKARGVPYFITYMQTVTLLKDKQVKPEYYTAWEEGLTDLISIRRSQLRYVLRYLKITRDFLTNFTLFASPAVTWRADSASFAFEFDKEFTIWLDKTTITGYSQRDSVRILKTHGSFIPAQVRWNGLEGHVTWVRAGYPAEDVWADLPSYTIDMTKSHYHADSVSFMNTTYFTKPVKGSFDDKIQKISQPGRALYPVFDSYEKVFKVDNIQKGIFYEGGLSMAGAVVKGTGTERKQAKLTFYRQDTLQLVIRSLSFSFRKDRFVSSDCSMTFMLDEDSIYHPNIAFTYNLATREVSFYQTNNLLTSAPFYDSYHQINATAKSFTWRMDEPVARLTRLRGTTIGEARFWSTHFFNTRHFYSLQGMDEQNPLVTVKRFVEWYYRDEFPVSELARWMGMPEHTARRMLVNLALEGFIYYNPKTGEAKVKQELYDYLEAFAGHIDYDVMMFYSKTKAPEDNAILNLRNQELIINGVPTIYLSDSQNVAIHPAGNRIIMAKNRSFSFNGTIQAGFSIYSGKNFFFNYDSFKIEMHNIDSLRLYAYGDKKDDLGRPVPEEIENIVEVITGSLYIDKPDNKAGLRNYAIYPYFQSTENSYVYYQETSVYDSVYTRDKFRFVIYPFTLSNLNKLTKENLRFDGEFISGGIFPGIPQKLIVQNDNSLGFTSDAPPEGFPIYNGKGRFYNVVKMSNHGLEGSGKLTYLTTTFGSDQYIFFPDSMVATAHDFQTTAQNTGTPFPDITGKDADLRWYPDEDRFHIKKRSENFQVFGNRTSLNGNLTLSPEGMYADGTFILPDATLWSNTFVLTDKTFSADTANFTVTAENQGSARLLADQVRAQIDIDRGSGIFQGLSDTIHLQFPENRYITSLDHLTWDINRRTIGLTNKRTSDDPYLFDNDPAALIGKWQVTPTFLSMNPKTDTLGFRSDSAFYDLGTHVLSTYHVDFLEIADAIIYPDKNTVTVEKDGNLRTLQMARLLANQNHTLDSVKINIFSRKDFFGSGRYTYTMIDGTEEKILFSNIKTDDSLHTYGETDIPLEQHFMLSPAFEYRGKVELFALKPFLTFSGGVRILHDCKPISRNFFKFSATIDPQNVMIPVEGQPMSDNNVKIYNGHYITIDSTHIYPAFLSRRKNYSDIPISTAEGFLAFDAASGEYRIGSREKLADTAAIGNYLALNRNYCTLYSEGNLDLGVNFGQMKMVTAGNIQQDMETDTVRLHVAIGLDFFFHPDALKMMSASIDSLTDLKPVNVRNSYYQKTLRMLIPEEAATRMNEETNLFGPAAELPQAIRHTIFLTNVTLVWNQMTNSYQSEGKMGVGNIDGQPLNVIADGYLEIQKKRSGDMLDLYLKFDEKDWYYFGYTRGVMQVLASDRSFLDIFRDLSPNQRRVKAGHGETPYTYMVGVDIKLSRFLRKMQMLHEQPPGDTEPER